MNLLRQMHNNYLMWTWKEMFDHNVTIAFIWVLTQYKAQLVGCISDIWTSNYKYNFSVNLTLIYANSNNKEKILSCKKIKHFWLNSSKGQSYRPMHEKVLKFWSFPYKWCVGKIRTFGYDIIVFVCSVLKRLSVLQGE